MTYRKRQGTYKANTTTNFDARNVRCEITVWQLANGSWTCDIVTNSELVLEWGRTWTTADAAKRAANDMVARGFRRVVLGGRKLIVVR